MAKKRPTTSRAKKPNKCARGFHRVRHNPRSPEMRCVDCRTKFVALPAGT